LNFIAFLVFGWFIFFLLGEWCFLCSISLELLVHVIDGFVGNSETCNRVDDNIVSPCFEISDIDIWCLAEFGHVSEKEGSTFRSISLECLSNNLEFISSVESFREDHISSGIDVEFWSADDSFETFNRTSVSSSADNKFTIGTFLAGFNCDTHFLSEVFTWYQGFSIEMAASLREDLVFNVQAWGGKQRGKLVCWKIRNS